MCYGCFSRIFFFLSFFFFLTFQFQRLFSGIWAAVVVVTKRLGTKETEGRPLGLSPVPLIAAALSANTDFIKILK
jgi:hypothetical protein